MKNKLVIHGSQYKDNFGDTLLVKVLIDNLNNKFDIYSSTGSEKVCHDLNIAKARPIDLITAKYFVFGGGGYFGQPNKNVGKWSLRFVVRHGIVGVMRRLLSRKYIFIGTGLGPLTHPLASRVAKFILDGADSVNLRDSQSVDYASSLTSNSNLNETADLVPGYISQNFKRTEQRKITLHMHLPVGDTTKLNKILNEYIDFRDRNFPGYDIEIISDSESDEEQTWFFDYINKKHEDIKLSPYSSFHETIDLLSSSSFVVTNKLHVAIVSASMGITVSSIYMHDKTKRFFEQLNRPNSAISLESIDDNTELRSIFEQVLTLGVDDDALSELIKKSKRNLDILDEWCK
ncbi:polysaccharide pyruvyl transferase family protein [Photobacterium sanguinicancri]|uniref:polysaccharide pyruvyl transferase family protein n=1 Tax=Photobacterium sanguinicancri TaxID=875932 RepID=UPI002480844A|nr:polysaccharide pyruvyl transferase family protein [Photobacterium sanguinicancri]